MEIKIGDTTLVHGQQRYSTSGSDEGKAVGPANLRISDTPGVAVREYVGASRVKPEHVKCDSGTITFGVTRTFASPANALAWATGRSSGQFLGEASQGEFKFGDTNPFGSGAIACVTQRQLAIVGCTVAVNYTVVG